MKSLLIDGIKDIKHSQEVRKKQIMILTLLNLIFDKQVNNTSEQI